LSFKGKKEEKKRKKEKKKKKVKETHFLPNTAPLRMYDKV